MERIDIGVVVTEPGKSSGLAAAAARHPDVAVHLIGVDAPSAAIAGLVVDVPLDQRGETLSTVIDRWQIPILCEMPAAPARAGAEMIARRPNANALFSINPLQYHLPTVRLREELIRAQDPLETFFGAWRFQRTASSQEALPQLMDYVGSIVGQPLIRLSAMHHADPAVLLLLLRYASNVIGSLEIGTHLPETLTEPSELLIECFCRESVYHCAAENQAIIVEGRIRRRRDWGPDPADGMVSAFVKAIRDGRAPQRGIHDDLLILALSEEILEAARDGETRLWTDDQGERGSHGYDANAR